MPKRPKILHFCVKIGGFVHLNGVYTSDGGLLIMREPGTFLGAMPGVWLGLVVACPQCNLLLLLHLHRRLNYASRNSLFQ